MLGPLPHGQTRHGSIRHTGSGLATAALRGTDKVFDLQKSTEGFNFNLLKLGGGVGLMAAACRDHRSQRRLAFTLAC